MVDARLPDGSRVNAIIPPLAVDGPLLSIRRFPAERLKAEDLVTLRSMTRPMLEFLEHCVRAKLNILISGGTGAGKTTLLNVLSGFISERERIVTIEDAAELQLHQEHVARLETRPPNVEGKGAIRQRQLLVNALRMRPDRIVVGEVRGEEALDMLQAMNTGHDGSLTTVHANTPRDALSRIETMIAMGATNLPERAMRQQIAAAIQIVIQQSRMSDGTRKVTEHLRRSPAWKATSSPCRRSSCSRSSALDAGRQGHRPLPRHRRAAEGLRAAEDGRHPPAGRHVRRRHGGAVMVPSILVVLAFVVGVGIVMGGYTAGREAAGDAEAAAPERAPAGSVAAARRADGAEPGKALVKVAERRARCRRSTGCSAAPTRGSALDAWIEQSGMKVTLSGVMLIALGLAVLLALRRRRDRALALGHAGRRGARLRAAVRRAEHQARTADARVRGAVPEALDLISRALKAGPCVRDRPEDGRRRDAGPGRPRVPQDLRRAELRSAAEGRARQPHAPRCRCSTCGSSRPPC